MPISFTTLGTAAAALVAVIGLVVLAGRAVRGAGLGGFRTSQRLAIRESLAIDRTRSLRIVNCDGRDLLLLIGGGSDVVVGWLAPGESVR